MVFHMSPSEGSRCGNCNYKGTVTETVDGLTYRRRWYNTIYMGDD